MRKPLKMITVSAVLFASAFPALSQPTYVPPNIQQRPGREQSSEGYINLQSNISLGLPYNDDAPVETQVEAAQRRIYALAAKQCELVRATIASECKISNLSNNVNSQRLQRDNAQIMVTVQITMSVKLKPTD
uniref:hypothetical protein n=1 Tax=Neorhizobium sp. EC2-8 TaxID=3129230 RepID=UPI0031016161